MRHKLLCLAALCAAGTAAAPAQAVTYGISENQPRMFSDPLFTQLGVKYTRLVVSYDVMTNTQVDNGDELRNVTEYMAQAQAQGVRVLVSFNHSRGNFLDCRKKSNRRKLRICKLPSVAEYRTNVKAFLDRFDPESVSAWNEINHSSQPTSKSPRRAAQFAKVVHQLHSGPVVDGDFLDFRFSRKYAKKFRKALGRRPSICGLHNYVDVNRNQTKGTRGMMKALRCKKYWWTETGGQYKAAGFPNPSQTRQAKATKRMFKLARKWRRQTQRVYNYSFYGTPTDRFDAGLVDASTGTARKSYTVFRNGI
jgi:hypothetical protein